MRFRHRHMTWVGVGAVFVLTACGGAEPEAKGPSSERPTGAASDTSTSRAAPSTTAEAPQSDASETRPRSTTPRAPENGTSRAAACAVDELRVSIGAGDGAAGSYHAPLRFTNAGEAPCVLAGYPGVSYVAGDDAHRVGAPAERVDQSWAPVTLRPGESAHATVRFLRVRNYEQRACEPTSVRAIRVYPPGETGSQLVSRSGTGCASTDIPGAQLTVKPVQPGPGGRQAG